MSQQVTIAIVDDHVEMCELLTKLIEQSGDYLVKGVFHDAEQAIRDIPALDPDIVFMDYNLPGMDGVSAARILLESCDDLSVIGICGLGSESVRDSFMDVGARGFSHKENLGAALGDLLEGAVRTV